MAKTKPVSSRAKENEKPRRTSTRAHTEADVVVAIQDVKKIGGIDHYLVKWSQSSRKDSWEPASDVKKVAKSLIDEFHESQNMEEYEVETLVDRKKVGAKVKYLVKWKGFTSDDNSWEESDALPANLIKGYEKQYGPLITKRDPKDESGNESPKKKSKPSVIKTTDISIVHSRKIINNVLHYEVKFVGQASTKVMPIFEIDDLMAISNWEKEHYAEGVEEESETEFTVERIISKTGTGKWAKYRVKWLGYPVTENTWEKAENLGGAKKILAEFEKKEEERLKKYSEKDYEVEKIVAEKLHMKKTWYMVKWKGYKSVSNTWEPEDALKESSSDVINQWQDKKVKIAEKRAESRQKAAERREKRKADKANAKLSASASSEDDGSQDDSADQSLEMKTENETADSGPDTQEAEVNGS